MPGSFCAAKGCSNHSYNTRDKAISFHRFPTQSPTLLNDWLVAIKRTDYTPTPNSRLCSLHFEENCFTYQNFTNRRHIKSDAIPTLFCHRPQRLRDGSLSQRLHCLKEKEIADSQSLKHNLAGSSDDGPFLNSGCSTGKRLIKNSSVQIPLNEGFQGPKYFPISDLRGYPAVEIEQECVMEPEIILEESENCILQYQPEVGVMSNFQKEDFFKSKYEGATAIFEEQNSDSPLLPGMSLITLSNSELYLVKDVTRKL